ncbi:substrate-binding periplasmic protein [Pseudoalteromonas denitrificans]|jgi:hypothetical protein|uniref:ABC-type amino acid transport substrate-binding protein n=1 Tax=Pseudoalteromonas denitrificans DSM 6059 TaxID=1123010 RepID=A0A1I1I3Y1_9GAMM|nr:transporter substrate-binding domain-containing protein [Pseudoalteromonas denitrificans]SFC31017.1 ABC-type amino acid transport substrate-binding protein [Pseudoalteromonas denitrificans DSM 6059]
MKRIVFILTASLFFTHASFAETVLKFTQIKDTPDQVVGAEILKEAYKKIGISIEILIMPGKRALKESSEGRADGEVHRIFEIGENYPTLLRVPTPINYIEPSVFSKKHHFKVTSCSALKDFDIAIVRGIKHAELCVEGMKNVIVFPYITEMLKLLDADKFDLAITAKLNGLLLKKEMNMKSIYPLSPPLSRMFVYHYLHEKNKGLVSKIDDVIIKMKETGELEIIREKAIKALLEKVKSN